ncbi:Cysteine metabolism repressor, partial [Dysosmobacter welbionis]
GRQHLVGRLVLLVTLGHHPAQMDFVQAPLRHSSEGLGAVSVSGVCLVNPAAQLRAAPAVEPVQHRLADELPIQPDGKVHRLPVFKIPFRHVEEAPLLHPAAQAAHIVIAPPAVPVGVQHQGVVGGDIRLCQGGEGQPLRLQLRNGLHVV